VARSCLEEKRGHAFTDEEWKVAREALRGFLQALICIDQTTTNPAPARHEKRLAIPGGFG
jgi:hypothetical protein